MSGPACATCRFWVPVQDPNGPFTGDCRRFPPAANQSYGLVIAMKELLENLHDGTKSFDPAAHTLDGCYGAWPETDREDWCGEYQTGGPSPVPAD